MNQALPTSVRGFVVALAGLGLGARILPLFDFGGRLFRQLPSEDGYLMLTIARNIALGHGMTTAAGTLPTNGTSPLSTYLWAVCFWLGDGDRAIGVLGVLLIEALISVASAWLLWRLGERLLGDLRGGRATAALTAAAWFASSHITVHAMNCLDTGLYGLAVLWIAWRLTSRSRGPDGTPSLRFWAEIGLLLGLTFNTRIDSIFLCLAIGLTHLFGVLPTWRAPLWTRVRELSVTATLTLLLGLPWMLNNLVRFGSLMPISGQSEGHGAAFGQSASELPAVLVEYLLVALPIPRSLQLQEWVIALCGGLLVIVAIVVVRSVSRWSPSARTLGLVAGAYGLGLCGFYGFFFGVAFFVSRYLFPLSPFLALLTAAALRAIWDKEPRIRRLAAPIAAVVFVLVLGTQARLYLRGTQHPHFQVVEWVDANTEESTWVGAIQTGTLGFFHDRTLNLDGKVNPDALAARQRSQLDEYILDAPLDFLADWNGLRVWMKRENIQAEFDLAVHDEARNLTVLERREKRDAALRD